MGQTSGIHHVTAIAGDPQQNLDFYTGLLGLRLVKLTVNFDDPSVYHFYYGDGAGSPGTLLTFFPWPGRPRGRGGSGQVTAIALSIPETAMAYWMDRLKSRGFAARRLKTHLGEEAIEFRDPDGLKLELVAARDVRKGWAGGPVPADCAIRGVYGVTLSVEGRESAASLLTRALGLRSSAHGGNRFRYEAGAGGAGAIIDLEWVPGLTRGQVAVGTVHHVAWRAPDGAQQSEWRQEIASLSYPVTAFIDRQYFHSIYFRERGGALFEVATDGPGFTVDEPAAHLGTRLALPPWLEARRAEIEARLPWVRLPQLAKSA
jgi:glyoxalase family protein